MKPERWQRQRIVCSCAGLIDFISFYANMDFLLFAIFYIFAAQFTKPTTR